jgi:hypothetical protein
MRKPVFAGWFIGRFARRRCRLILLFNFTGRGPRQTHAAMDAAARPTTMPRRVPNSAMETVYPNGPRQRSTGSAVSITTIDI